MHRVELTKPDGRRLLLYGREPVTITSPVRGAGGGAPPPNPHLRWHPLRGEWVACAPHRQNRTFLPPPEFNPLLPSSSVDAPTELPLGRYDVAVFDNLFPTLTPGAHDPPSLHVATRPARGRCEVVVFTQDPYATLATLPLDRIELLLEVWGERTDALGADPQIEYVLPFENKGVEVGVTLHHPHGQIYAYPFIPPVPRRSSELEELHLARTGVGLLESMIESESAEGDRMIYEGPHAVAFVPVCARYPYEVWVAPRRRTEFLSHLRSDVRADLARAVKTTLLKYDGLWGRSMPYLMAWYQAPTDGRTHPGAHLRAEFWPPYRTRDRLKYLAGTELAAGMFAGDAIPEEKARELQVVPVEL